MNLGWQKPDLAHEYVMSDLSQVHRETYIIVALYATCPEIRLHSVIKCNLQNGVSRFMCVSYPPK